MNDASLTYYLIADIVTRSDSDDFNYKDADELEDGYAIGMSIRFDEQFYEKESVHKTDERSVYLVDLDVFIPANTMFVQIVRTYRDPKSGRYEGKQNISVHLR